MENKAFERFLKALPDDVVDSFNTHQLQALDAVVQKQWRRHPIDIRVTVPFLWKKFYLVVVAGPEQRSPERRKTDRRKFPFWTLTNIAVTGAFMLLGLVLAAGLFQFKVAVQDLLVPAESYPTSIPFLENQQDCEASGRSWEGGECIDYVHDRTF